MMDGPVECAPATTADAQVKEHEAVLDAIDKRLLPAARSEELKSFLSKLRVRLAEHLEVAKKTQAELGKKT